jgi:hypothetical protein
LNIDFGINNERQDFKTGTEWRLILGGGGVNGEDESEGIYG